MKKINLSSLQMVILHHNTDYSNLFMSVGQVLYRSNEYGIALQAFTKTEIVEMINKLIVSHYPFYVKGQFSSHILQEEKYILIGEEASEFINNTPYYEKEALVIDWSKNSIYML